MNLLLNSCTDSCIPLILKMMRARRYASREPRNVPRIDTAFVLLTRFADVMNESRCLRRDRAEEPITGITH